MKNTYKKFVWFLLLALTSSTYVLAQERSFSSDDLFQQARNIPKEKNNYPKIIGLLKQALEKAPDYADVRIFLGRVYTWGDKLDSARYQFNQVLAKDPKNIDALTANFNVEYWNNNYDLAIDHSNRGLLYYPDSALFIIQKAKALTASKNIELATKILEDYYKQHPNETTVKAMMDELNPLKTKNAVDVNYEFVYFDKRFDEPWHFASVSYLKNTKYTSLIARINYSNRFGTNGVQAELEAYPYISKRLYGYVAGSYSNSNIFQRYRLGGSLHYVLPNSFDLETGIRYLDFRTIDNYSFVLAVGKYIGSYYLNLKAFVSPDRLTFNSTYILSGRYYFSDRFNYLGAQIGAGISPDDRARNITGFGTLRSYNIGANYAKDLIKNFTLSLNTVLFYEEYGADLWGNQISAGFSLSRRF